MEEIRFLFLGTPQVQRHGQDVPLQRRKALALLAYLGLHDQPQSRELLATLLWPELSGSRGRGNLRRELSLLRTQLGDGLFGGDRLRLGFRPEAPFWIDARRFRELVDRTRHEEIRLGALDVPTIRMLEEAADLYQGDFLAGFSLPDSPEFDDWQFQEADSLRQSLAWALERLAGWHRRQDDLERATNYARRWVDLDRYHEPAQRELIRCLALDNRWSAALHQYKQLATLLDDQLGIEPEEETRKLGEQIASRRLDETSEWVVAAATRSTGVIAHPESAPRLPRPAAHFIGRDFELAELERLLTNPEARLVTVLGPGGMGKTNLALAYGRSIVERDDPHPLFADGVHFIVLSDADTREQVPFTVAQALGLYTTGAPEVDGGVEQQIIDYLRSRKVLLILDNAEASSGVADFVARIIAKAPDAHILVTSRSRLQLVEEHLLVIQGMALPDRLAAGDAVNPAQLLEFPAVELFVQCVRRHQPAFTLTDENTPTAVAICRQVGGMPLAIELAASHISVLSLDAIADEISRNLDILATEIRNIPERQRSMNAIISASWQGLSGDDQRVFAALAVFKGGWTRDAAYEVSGATLAALSRFIDQSLIIYDAGADRYAMHEMLRQFAAGKFGQDAELQRATRERHARYYLGWFASRAEQLYGFEQSQTMRTIRLESANLGAAWAWAVEHQAWTLIEPVLDGYAQFLELDGRYREGQQAFENLVEALDAAAREQDPEIASLLTRALVWKGVMEQWLGRSDLTTNSINAALALLDSPVLTGHDPRATRALALLNSGVGRFSMLEQESVETYHEALKLFRELGDRWNEARALTMLGRVAWSRADFELANQYYREALALQREIGDEREIISLLVLMSSAARYEGRFQEAMSLSNEIIERSRRSGDQVGMGLGLSSIGASYSLLGQFERAREALLESHELLERTGALLDRVVTDMRLGFAIAALGIDEEARHWYEMARDHYLQGSMAATAAYVDSRIAEIDLANDMVELARSRLEPGIETLRAVERPAAYCFMLSMMAVVHCRQGEVVAAASLACEALGVALQKLSNLPLVWAMLALPVIMDEAGRPDDRDAVLALLAKEPWLARDRTMQRWMRLQFPPRSDSPLEPAQKRLVRLEQEARRQLDVLANEIDVDRPAGPSST